MTLLNINQRKLWFKQHIGTEPHFILLHNAGGDHRFLLPQFNMLANMGCSVTAVDFLGHSQSKATEEQQLSIASFAADIIELCTQLNIHSTSIIGLNYGANVALEIAAQQKSLPHNIIMIDPPILIPDETRKLIASHLQELGEITPEIYAKQLVSESFINASEEVKKTAYDVFKHSSHLMMKRVYTDLLDWDHNYGIQRIANLTTPTLCIFTDASLCGADALQQVNSTISTAKVAGSKYWASIEVPEQINAMIKRYAKIDTCPRE